jgi:CHAD domain-containing protein
MGRAIAITPDESAALSASAGRYLRKELQSIIGSSEAMIPEAGFPGPDEVHDIRVNMKRGRAVLKLLRDSPGTEFYRRENESLRHISSLFSQSRETDVLKKTLRMLAKRHPLVFTADVVSSITREASPAGEEDKIALAALARELLRRSWYRIGFVSLSGVTRNTLLDGLWSSFNRASLALAATKTTSRPEDAHEFRKRSKDLLYQVRFFSDYNPGHFENIHSRLDHICSVLGKCNDLAVAGSIVSDLQKKSGDEMLYRVIMAIEKEKNEMLGKIYKPAGDLFETFYSGG